MESYRSGHNEPDSKSGSPKGLEGSNPSLSVIIKTVPFGAVFFVYWVGVIKNGQYVFTYRAVLTNAEIVTIPI